MHNSPNRGVNYHIFQNKGDYPVIPIYGYSFVNEFVEDGFIEIIFVKTKDNVADIFTKNTSGEIDDRHHDKMVKEIETKQEGC